MRLTRQRILPRSLILNMAAMIDVVFLLLIFFMCTSSFAKPEQDLALQLPESSGAESAARDLEPIRVKLTERGGISCDGRPCEDVTGAPSFEALTATLRARRALGIAAIDELPVIIEGDPGVHFGRMVAALDAAYDAGVTRVAFSARGTSP